MSWDEIASRLKRSNLACRVRLAYMRTEQYERATGRQRIAPQREDRIGCRTLGLMPAPDQQLYGRHHWDQLSDASSDASSCVEDKIAPYPSTPVYNFDDTPRSAIFDFGTESLLHNGQTNLRVRTSSGHLFTVAPLESFGDSGSTQSSQDQRVMRINAILNDEKLDQVDDASEGYRTQAGVHADFARQAGGEEELPT